MTAIYPFYLVPARNSPELWDASFTYRVLCSWKCGWREPRPDTGGAETGIEGHLDLEGQGYPGPYVQRKLMFYHLVICAK
jgi:hypothetical protein